MATARDTSEGVREVVPPTVDDATALDFRLRQQALLAELGRRALATSSVDELLQEASRLVALGLETSFCKVLQYLPHEGRLLVRAGVGWEDRVIGIATIEADLSSPAGYALHTGKPVISNDLHAETRFRTPDLLRRHGIERAINVILTSGGKPFGVLEADSQVGGNFTEHDIDFLQGAASLLGFAIDRHADAEALKRLNDTLEQRIEEEVAERQQAEQALQAAQKMEAVGQLTGGVAHDFNNLLTVIRGNLDLVAAAVAGNDKLAPLLDAAQRGVERGEKLTSQLLAFARRQTLHPQVCNLNDVVREFDVLAARLLGETIALAVDLDPELSLCELDTTQFSSALLNLLVNAGDAMSAGGTVTIRTRKVELGGSDAARIPEAIPGQYVMVSIEDTGEGMTPEVLARATEPFFTTKDTGKGTGLGLSQVYGFVRQSDGFLTIDSEPGAGTSVRLYLPQADKALPAPDLAPAQVAAGGVETILVVEDDADVRLFVATALAAHGYRTLQAGNAAEALDVLRTGERVNLLFTDAVLPGGKSGIELAQEARRQRPQLKILLTSGYPAAETPPTDFLESISLLKKPYRVTELYHLVRKALTEQEGAAQ
jgi:signal transduction histidine kinase/ActR/RegA family two-component response regulator